MSETGKCEWEGCGATNAREIRIEFPGAGCTLSIVGNLCPECEEIQRELVD